MHSIAEDVSFGAHCTNLNEDRPILSATKIYANDSSLWKYKVYATNAVQGLTFHS